MSVRKGGIPAKEVKPGLWIVDEDKYKGENGLGPAINWNKPMIPQEYMNLVEAIESLKQVFLFALNKIKTQEEWDELRESVKIKGLLPSWWQKTVIESGLFEKFSEKWEKNKKPKWRNLFDE